MGQVKKAEMFILGLYIHWHIACHSVGPDGWMVSEAAWQTACPWFDFGPVPWRWQIHIFLFGNFILFKKVFYSNLSRGMLNLPVNVSFNGYDLKTFLSKIINSLMFLDHSHIISSLANQNFFFFQKFDCAPHNQQSTFQL